MPIIRLAVPTIGEEEIAAVERVLRSGYLVHGPEGEAFEQELAAYLGCREVVVVTSGTAALHLSLLALGIGPGDAVLVPDFTFPATANAVEAVGARPVFADVDPVTYNLAPGQAEDAIRAWKGPEKLRAILPVHEFGCPADMPGLLAVAERHDLLVVEDAACALGTEIAGRKAGTWGRIGCFSFHPRKAITTGEGGALATDDPGLAATLRKLRNHGMEATPSGMRFAAAGLNYRLTNFQSALGRVQLRRFDGWLRERRELQAYYREQLAGAPLDLPAEVAGHAWQTFMVVLPDGIDRAQVIAAMRDLGVETNLGAQCLHALDYYGEKYPADAKALGDNAAARLYRSGLALPLYQGMPAPDVTACATALKSVLKALTKGMA